MILLLQTNLIKESIRMGYNDIGDFFYAHGQLSDAFKSYIRTRDYCTTSKHIVQMCMNVILVSIELGQYAHVSNYVSKAEQTPDSLDPIIVAKLKAAAGLANLETKKYKLAARKVSHQFLISTKGNFNFQVNFVLQELQLRLIMTYLFILILACVVVMFASSTLVIRYQNKVMIDLTLSMELPT